MDECVSDWPNPNGARTVLPVLTMLHWSEVVIVTDTYLSQVKKTEGYSVSQFCVYQSDLLFESNKCVNRE